MSEGIIAELPELIALKRYARKVGYQPKLHATRNGNHLSKLRGRGMDFAEVRHYQPGDEIRHMEWRVTARTGRAHVKLYQEERERPAMILTDFSPSMFFGTRQALKSVVAARLSALLAWTATMQGDRIGGLVFSLDTHHEFTPRGREAGVLPLLASLSSYTRENITKTRMPATEKLLSHALQRLRRVSRPGSIIVLLSDFYHFDDECEQHLRRLRAHNDVLAYHICDPLELAPPKPQQYAITDGQQEILLDTTLNTVHDAYQKNCEQRILLLRDKFQKLQVPYIQVTAEMDLPLLVRQTYPGRAYGS